jgi:NAD-dependent deacetylase
MSEIPERLSEAAKWLREAERLVVFTGAGISAESGIPTFRDDNGFWQRFPPERYARWDGLLRTAIWEPAKLSEFLHAVIHPIAIAQPNAAHRAIAALGKYPGCTVITQNVDGLHQAAGSQRVREIHGSFLKVVSTRGRLIRRLSHADLQLVAARLERAQQGAFRLPRLAWALRPLAGLSPRGIRRPNVVLFGEAMAEPDWSWARADAGRCDLMLVVGTSSQVWPAAELPIVSRQEGARIITIDPLEPGNSHLWLRGKAGAVLPNLIEAMSV